MKIPVLGMDPSLRNWGLAEAELCLDTGILSTPVISIVATKSDDSMRVRQNSKDLQAAEDLAAGLIPAALRAKVVFVEVPVGSKSARAMASYGTCVGIMGTLRASGIQLIEVTPTEVKTHFTGNKNATKDDMIQKAMTEYPDAAWPMLKGKVVAKAEHMADAIAAIHAGVRTPVFKQLMRLIAP